MQTSEESKKPSELTEAQARSISKLKLIRNILKQSRALKMNI